MALRRTGPTIGAAGLILAGTFASLMLAGNTILSQIGFAVSCGIALAAFVMAMFSRQALPRWSGTAPGGPGTATRGPRRSRPPAVSTFPKRCAEEADPLLAG